MLSYPITGVREGTLQAERDGLYWNVSAVCSKDWDFPIRLIAETAGARPVLGVPPPGPGGRNRTWLSKLTARIIVAGMFNIQNIYILNCLLFHIS